MKTNFKKKVLSAALIAGIGLTSSANAAETTKLIESLPAPGQFVNKEPFGNASLDKITNMSLGAFGGQITVKMDKSIVNNPNNKFGIDFTIKGNPFKGNSEPGAVMVMEDKNGNGKADDGEWYELAGSHYYDDNTKHNYEITYKSLEEEGKKVNAWTDNYGQEGIIKTNNFHKQDYFPAFETFQNTAPYQVEAGNFKEGYLKITGTSLINNRNVNYGYVDAYYEKDTDSKWNGNGFDLEWAVDKSGKKVKVDKVDFIKVYTAMQMDLGMSGELSVEVMGMPIATSADESAYDQTKLSTITVENKDVVLSDFDFDSTKDEYNLDIDNQAKTLKLSISEDLDNAYINSTKVKANDIVEIDLEKNDKVRIFAQDKTKATTSYMLYLNKVDASEVNDTKAAKEVEKLINKLPENITLANKEQVNGVKKAYDALNDNAKAKVDTKLVKKLDNAVAKIKDLDKDNNQPKPNKPNTNKPKAKNRTIKAKGTTYYQKLVNGKYLTTKKVVKKGSKTSTYEYKIVITKSVLTKSVLTTKSTSNTKTYKIINKKSYLTKQSIYTKYKNKKVRTYFKTIKLYKNGKIKEQTRFYKDKKTNKYTKKDRIDFGKNGKKTKKVTFTYKKGLKKLRLEYKYNKKGQLKTNKNGKAFRYSTKYVNKKAQRTFRKAYKANGKLSVYYNIYRARTTF